MEPAELTYLKKLRYHLHRYPELSGEEQQTAEFLRSELLSTAPDRIVEQVGGTGLLVSYDSGKPGPSLLLRCELDALPIQEEGDGQVQSARPGVSHACGHDGHMTVMVGVARMLRRRRPPVGSVSILFQPSEETGQGAFRVLEDDRFRSLEVDRAYAWHNLPGFEQGALCMRTGSFAFASTGLQVNLKGWSSHAAYPEQGRTPVPAVTRLIEHVSELADEGRKSDGSVATVTYIRMGEKAFGITPGEAEIGITLRAPEDRKLRQMQSGIEAEVRSFEQHHGLETEIRPVEPFPAVMNGERAAGTVRRAAGKIGMKHRELEKPFPWSEDFGYFGRICELTLLGIGAGRDWPHLHAPHYRFPDELIPVATELFNKILEEEWKN